MAVDYSQAEKDRELLIKQRQRNTARSFEAMRKKIDEQIATMNMSTVSEKAKRQQLEEIRYQLQKSLGAFYSNLEDGLKSDMVSIGESVLNDSEAFYNSLNMPISMSITSFPVDVMENVINGSVYKEKWFLSNALWGDYQSKLDDINQVITEGIGMNLSSFEIAQQLEQFVDPSAMKPSATIVTPCLQDPETGKLYSMDYVKRHPEKDWSNFKEKTSRFRYGKVDYNAQRLARTLVSHAYQQNVVRQAQANPFATGVKWEASGGERMCEICEERDGKIFPVDDVPMDHPNGMCTFTVETPSMKEMSDTLADWVNGEPTDWDDQLNAYYEGRPIEHKIQLSDDKKESKVKTNADNLPDELIDIIGLKGDPISPDELLGTVNPNFDDKSYPYRYYHNNCQRCVVAYELGRRGYDVEALNFNGDYSSYYSLFKTDYTNFNGRDSVVLDKTNKSFIVNRSPSKTTESVYGIMNKWGEGSRGFLSVSWRNSSTSHVVNIENVGGIITIYDAQSGIKTTDIEQYLSRTKCAEMELIRSDTMKFKTDLMLKNEKSYKRMITDVKTICKKRRV